MTRIPSIQFATSIVALVLGLSGAAQAGPPLICHAIQIGQAKSLPWTADGLSGAANYNLKHLVSDTLAILVPDTPVLVRMEALRRATIYARNDPQVAKELLSRLYQRASDHQTAGRLNALAWFDAGYLVACYKQWIGQNLPHMTDGLRLDPNPAAGLDGYAWVRKAISLQGSDPEMEFAAALITLGGPQKDCQEHTQKAMIGAKSDPLLAQNLSSRFGGRNSETMAEMFSKVTTAKN
jgi:hypothetical protein